MGLFSYNSSLPLRAPPHPLTRDSHPLNREGGASSEEEGGSPAAGAGSHSGQRLAGRPCRDRRLPLRGRGAAGDDERRTERSRGTCRGCGGDGEARALRERTP